MKNDIIFLGATTGKKTKKVIYKQSANALFNFMDKKNYLEEVLETQRLYPRYCEENINYLKNKTVKKIAFPMKCFCDIYLNKLVPHMKLYGEYGIALEKEWGLLNNIQPVQYVNMQSRLVRDLKNTFRYCLKNPNKEKMYQTVLSNLKYVKPLTGSMKRNGKIKRNCIFHDEKEWRYVPSISEEDSSHIRPLVTDETNMTAFLYNQYSREIMKYEKYALKINYSDIKYLIIKNKKDRKSLIDCIIEKCNCSYDEKYVLISKILVIDDLGWDW